MSRTAAPPHVKRVFDVIAGGALFIVLLPFMGLVAALVRVGLGTPVIFRQTRPGLGGRPFELRKFRTMSDAKDADGRLLPDTDRMTAVGRWLRRSSLDELPELLNVMRGEMSLVGPRPLLMQYLARYTPRQARRHEMRPGITGLAQVSGRNRLSWEERFEMDVWYVDHWSLALDLRILFRTAVKVIVGDGITQPGHDTAAEFQGTTQPPRPPHTGAA